MFWFTYTTIRGQLVIIDVSSARVRGVRWFTAALSEDPRVTAADLSPDGAVARLIARLEGTMAA